MNEYIFSVNFFFSKDYFAPFFYSNEIFIFIINTFIDFDIKSKIIREMC